MLVILLIKEPLFWKHLRVGEEEKYWSPFIFHSRVFISQVTIWRFDVAGVLLKKHNLS